MALMTRTGQDVHWPCNPMQAIKTLRLLLRLVAAGLLTGRFFVSCCGRGQCKSTDLCFLYEVLPGAVSEGGMFGLTVCYFPHRSIPGRDRG
jgi:hypothetical protein